MFEPGGLSGPALWASMGTGMPPTTHGVTSVLEVRPDGGGVQPVGARSWAAPPFWQTLADAGIRTAVVGCPGLAPASAWAGCVADERFAQPAGVLIEDWPLPPDCITPPRLRAALRPLRVHPDELEPAETGGLPPRALAIAASNHAAATHIAEHEDWQVLVVHQALLLANKSEAAYAFIDAMLSRLVLLAGPESDVLLVSPTGLLIASGPSFAVDTVLHGIVPADIAATVLARFGIAIEGTTGRPLLAKAVAAPQRVTPSVRPRRRFVTPPPSSAAQRVIDALEHEANLSVAGSALAAGDHVAASLRLQAMLARRPVDTLTLFLLGQCQFFLHEATACQSTGERLAALDPKSPWGSMMVGAALMLQDKADEGTPYLEAASQLAAREPAAHVRLGAIMLHLGRAESAEAHYRAALEIDPANADARAGVGLARLALDDAEGAEANLRGSLALRYHAPALHHQLGVLYTAQSRWAEAARALRTALAQHPGLPGAETLLRHVEDRIAARLLETSML